MKMLKELLDEDMEEQTDAAVKELLPSVHPIYLVNERFGPEQTASCILFSEDNIHLLITAGHVFDNLQGSAVYVGGEKRLVHLKGQHYRTRPDGRAESDKYDLAFVELDEEALSCLGNVRFLHSSDLDPNDVAAKGHYYLVLGYPATKNKRINYESYKAPHNLYIYSASSPALEKYRRLSILEETHILLDFDKKMIADKANKLVNPPKLQGISGGGIWRIRDYTDVASLAGPSPRKLVGIVIEGHPMQKIIMGVRISCIIEAIKHQYPVLREKLPNVNRIYATINSKVL